MNPGQAGTDDSGQSLGDYKHNFSPPTAHNGDTRPRGGAALATSAIGSFVAGTIGTAGVAFLAPVVVGVAPLFGPAEYFSLMILGFPRYSAPRPCGG